MLNIGNKKLKDANIGTTPLDSIYLVSTLIWRKEYVQWYDPEFKRVILEKYNNGKQFRTKDELNLVVFSKMFDNNNPQLISFENNTKIKTIKDLEKFLLFPGINNLFKNCSSLGTEYIESTGETNYTELNIPKSVNTFNSGSFIGTNYTNIKFPVNNIILGKSPNDKTIGYNFDLNSQVFGNMSKLQGILNIPKGVDIQNLQEFYNIGNYGQGIQVVLDTDLGLGITEYNTFGGWSRFKDIIKPLSEYVEP